MVNGRNGVRSRLPLAPASADDDQFRPLGLLLDESPFEIR